MSWQDEQNLDHLQSYEPSFWRNITIMGDDENECWNWNKSTASDGYGRVGIRKEDSGKTTTIPAHRFSWLIHAGLIPENLFCLHKCDNTKCCNPSHLYLGTQSDNMQDKHRRGRMNGYKHSEEVKARISATEIATKKLRRIKT